MPKKKPEFIRFTTVKEYISNVLKIRSSDGAVKKLIKNLDSTTTDILVYAQKLAKKDRRNTILDADVIPAMEKYLGNKHLTWDETAEEIIGHNATDLGKIFEAINNYLREHLGDKFLLWQESAAESILKGIARKPGKNR